MVTSKTGLKTLYTLAINADAAYSQVVSTLYGAKVTRWTMTPAQSTHPEVRAALTAKLDADNAFLQAFTLQVARGHSLIR